jgi:hypothetical protein
MPPIALPQPRLGPNLSPKWLPCSVGAASLGLFEDPQ